MSKPEHIDAVEISIAGPWSQGVRAGPFIYSSGLIPVNPETMKVEAKSIEDQVRQCMLNLQTVFERAGGSLENTIKITVYLLDYRDFAAMDSACAAFFKDKFPARTCVTVKELPVVNGVQVRAIIEGVAYLPNQGNSN